MIFVTNTAESGEGSLRACIDAAGPRTCVFRLSGTITLKERSLIATNPYLTIAGETAPGDGIAIRNGPEQVRPSLEIKTHDVIVRHLRLRPGPHAVPSCCSGALGLYTSNAHDIIIDHVSFSWGSDETVDSEDATNVTFQWCIFSEPLLNGGPGKKNRARNLLLTKGGDFTIANSLFAFGIFRNPMIAPAVSGSTTDIINNVFYSPLWDYVISFEDSLTTVRANIIGNYKIAGRRGVNDRLVHLFEKGNKGFQLYIARNFDETYALGDTAPQVEALLPDKRHFATSEPLGLTPDAIAPHDAYQAVLRDAGATRPQRDVADKRILVGAGATRPARDAVDLRMVDAVRTRSGALLKTHPEAVGGWPPLASSPPPADEDLDGMADAWERSVGLAPNDSSDGVGDLDGDGWTNFEEYLHELAGDSAGMRTVKTGSSAS